MIDILMISYSYIPNSKRLYKSIPEFILTFVPHTSLHTTSPVLQLTLPACEVTGR